MSVTNVNKANARIPTSPPADPVSTMPCDIAQNIFQYNLPALPPPSASLAGDHAKYNARRAATAAIFKIVREAFKPDRTVLDNMTHAYRQNPDTFSWDGFLLLLEAATKEKNAAKISHCLPFFTEFYPDNFVNQNLGFTEMPYSVEVVISAYKAFCTTKTVSSWQGPMFTKLHRILERAAYKGQWGGIAEYLQLLPKVVLDASLANVLYFAMEAYRTEIVDIFKEKGSLADLKGQAKQIYDRIHSHYVWCQSLLKKLPMLEKLLCCRVWKKQWDLVERPSAENPLSPACIQALQAIGQFTDQQDRVNNLIMDPKLCKEKIAAHFRENPPESPEAVQKYILDTYRFRCTYCNAEEWYYHFQKCSPLYDILD